MEAVFQALASGKRRKLLAYLSHSSMTAGEIVEQNEPHEFFNNPQHDRTKLFLSQILHQ